MGKIGIQFHSLACGYPVFPIAFFEEISVSQLSSVVTYLRGIFFLGLDSVPLVCVSFLPVPHCFDTIAL